MALNYKVTGGDGSEYGPVLQDDVEQWILDGRIIDSTPVWRSDTANWKAAEEYLELGFSLNQAAKSPIHEEDEEVAAIRPVGFLPRMIAYLVDYFIMTALMTAILPLFNRFVDLKETGNVMELIRQPGFWVILGVQVSVAGVFNVLFNGHFGATPGKIMIGAKIVTEDGSPIGYGRALCRYLAEWISAFSLGVGYLFVAFRPDRRALHDLIAGTRVVFLP
jgi:uncharacterized RDD family membrane protein YckC